MWSAGVTMSEDSLLCMNGEPYDVVVFRHIYSRSHHVTRAYIWVKTLSLILSTSIIMLSLIRPRIRMLI